MPSFLSDITPFKGTGEKNADGLGLREYLEAYNPLDYENPSVTADIIVFRPGRREGQEKNKVQVLLVKRANHPCIGQWALPGGFVNIREDLEAAARRELEEETGLAELPMEQLYTWGEASRDPRSRIVTTAYLAVLEEENAAIQAGDDAADAIWADVFFRRVGEKRVSGRNADRIERRYEIILSAPDKNLEIHSEVTLSQRAEGILKEPAYTVIKGGGLAFDHPRFLLQALLYLQEKTGFRI